MHGQAGILPEKITPQYMYRFVRRLLTRCELRVDDAALQVAEDEPVDRLERSGNNVNVFASGQYNSTLTILASGTLFHDQHS